MHADLHRQVWIEETGVSTVWMDAADIPTWTEQSIRTMASCDNLFGITWWDSHDLNPKLTGYVNLEYDLGLFTNDREIKPIRGDDQAADHRVRRAPAGAAESQHRARPTRRHDPVERLLRAVLDQV